MLDVGDILAQRYRVVRWLARGGFAEVYVVEHVHLHSRHALKVLREASEVLRARLLEEGRIQAKLRHPGIVRVTDVVDLGEQGVGLVMDLVQGPSLTQHLANGPLPHTEAQQLGAAILCAVKAAHQLGLVHRDLKPDNILLERTSTGLRPRVTDFGLARARLATTGTRHTRPKLGMGTPAYMSPEQVRDAASVDERADLFALGAILYELVAGRPAFDAKSPTALFRQVATGDRPAIDELVPDRPESMVEAIESALEPDADLRVASCEELMMLWTLDAPTEGAFAQDDAATSSPPVRASSREPAGATLGPDFFSPLDDVEPHDAGSSAESLPTPPEPELASASTKTDPVPPPSPQAPVVEPGDDATLAGPAPKRWTARALLLAAVGLLAGPSVALTRLTDRLDVFAHARLLEHAVGALPSRRTVVLTLPEVADMQSLRARYPDLLRQLAEAGVASVSFDLGFSAKTPDDEALAAAVDEQSARGIPVVAEGREIDGALVGPGTPALDDALLLGLATIETEGWLPPPTISMDSPETWPDLTGKAVMVGAMASQDQFMTSAGLLYGAFLQAAAIETFAAARVPSPVTMFESTLTTLVVGVGGLVSGVATGRRWAVLGVLLLVLVFVWSRAVAGEMVPLGPIFVAAGGAWAALRSR